MMSQKLIVSKFGGSSVADTSAMLRSASVALKQSSFVVLVSATYGTTNKLIELVNLAEAGEWGECEGLLFHLREKHLEYFVQLTNNSKSNEELVSLLDQLETLVKGISLMKECSPKAYDQVLSFGERMSSLIFKEALQGQTDKEVILVDARNFIITNSNFGTATPFIDKIEQKCSEYLPVKENVIYLTQGFIGSDKDGLTTTLGRGGSDYSASLIAEAINADVLEIWTDVAGIATTDPRICEKAQIIHEISYGEASEMAQYGAKILHPTTLVPAMRKQIPVFVGSSLDSDAPGTWIREKVEGSPLIRAITLRKEQALLTIRTPKMLNAFGFMQRIFEVFSRFRISVDCVTTSEISVAITIDKKTLEHSEFIDELKKLGEVKVEQQLALVSLIGNQLCETAGVADSIFSSIEQTNIRMMSLGASDYNFNILVKENDASVVINNLHNKLIGENIETRANW
jgi:aspartate kinase